MKRHDRRNIVTFMVALAVAWAILPVATQANEAPTKWGADDKIGAMNVLGPKLVLKHLKLVKTGKWATLGKVYQSDAPFFGVRGFKLTIPGLPTGGPFGEHELVYNDEMVTTELGQVGTQFDGPGHIGVITSKGHMFYNGATLAARLPVGQVQPAPPEPSGSKSSALWRTISPATM